MSRHAYIWILGFYYYLISFRNPLKQRVEVASMATASFFEKLQLEDPWLPPKPWELISSESSSFQPQPSSSDSLCNISTLSVSSTLPFPLFSPFHLCLNHAHRFFMEIEISETLTRQLTPKCKAMLGLFFGPFSFFLVFNFLGL